MRRKIYDKLLEWKSTSNGRSAVMLDGARRVGKSWIAEEFARREYDNYLLFVSMAFAENELSSGDLQERLLTGRLEVNAGMLYETLVAQMLRVAGHQLYFYVSDSNAEAAERMEIDFLVERSDLQRRHNIQPIEVKSTGEYETSSLAKFIRKYGRYLGDPCVLHTKDLKKASDRLYLPVYMAGFIGNRSLLVGDVRP